ncbi:MAG TPA: bifunctional glutamate N-acetyltransferase/amino-acid acetyltransferase ArgJ [Methanoregulaceae archaeon]|nr:bifunctional glutamate N-acetyltransferase/amino-acid acetyltransferase ArgJ [Methanoregulaceae archaeon]
MKSICGVEGVLAAGIKEGKNGLTLITAAGTAAGVFTSNLARAPPILLMQEQITRGRLEAVIANSGCANAYTGKRGYEDARQMTNIAAAEMKIDPESVGVASTGVIGRYLDLPLITRQAKKIVPLLSHSPSAEDDAARGIMTTDLFEKHALVRKETFSVGGITKGSGMIAPNMGTMLAFIYTDAEVGAPELRDALKQAVKRTFNRVVVDGDESTNDIALCTATGLRGPVKKGEFREALEECCRNLAVQIATDGEGATKLIEIRVTGAPAEDDAAQVARTVAGSPLVKTAVYGEDPNWGRVIAAAGRAGVEFDPGSVSLWISDGVSRTELVRTGEIVVDLAHAKALMAGKKVVFELDLHAGREHATVWGCDLTERYVEINGRYTT